MLKIPLIFVFAFGIGFLTHALYFPDIFANGIVDVQRIALPNTVPTQGPGANSSEFETKITYDGKHFSRNNITIGVGNYLMIINNSADKLMWLQSNEPSLATMRGYGELEAIRQRMDASGQYIVVDKNNPREKLIITVK